MVTDTSGNFPTGGSGDTQKQIRILNYGITDAIKSGYGNSQEVADARNKVRGLQRDYILERAQEVGRLQAEADARKLAEELAKAKAEQDRQAQLKLIQEKAAREKVSFDVARVRLNAENARNIRAAAASSRIDISTPVRERAFINRISQEAGTPVQLQEQIKTYPTPSKININDINIPQKRTISDWENINKTYEIQTSPYIKPYTEDYQGTKITGYTYVNPLVEGKQFERQATQEEIRQATALSERTGTAKTGKYDPLKLKYIDITRRTYETSNVAMQEVISPAISNRFYDLTSAEQVKPAIKFVFPALAGIDKALGKDYASNFLTGAYTGIMTDIKTKPAKQAILLGASYVAGFAVQGITTAAYAVPKIGAYTGLVTKAGIFGIGTYLGAGYVSSQYTQIYNAPSNQRAGMIGVSLKDIGLLATGTKAGSKGFQQAQGYIATYGRTEIIKISQGDYPQASQRTHLSLFRQNIYTELGEKPGAFHTTPQKFWGEENIITPKEGASELPGLYGSTQISRPFLKLPGYSSDKINWNKLWADIIAPPSKPAIAYLQPKGFRYSKVGWTGKPIFKTQVAVQGRYGYFKSPVRSGYADVPGVKSEIEAVFRPRAGSYSLTSNQFFVKVNNIRVPLDTFKYDSSLNPTTNNAGASLFGGRSSYNLLPKIYFKPIVPLSSTKSSVSITNIPQTHISIASSKVSHIYSNIPSLKSSVVSAKSSIAPSRISSKVSQVSSRVSGLSSTARSIVSSKVSKISYAPYSYSGRSSATSYIPYYSGGGSIKTPPRIQLSSSKLKLSTPKYSVQVRRFGKFKTIGSGLSLNKALEIGRKKTATSLAASFKVLGLTGAARLPAGYYRSKREAGVIIEQPRYRLSTGTEKREINLFRGLAAKKKKKRGILSLF